MNISFFILSFIGSRSTLLVKLLNDHNFSISVEKDPMNTLYFSFLKQNIKDSKFIFLTINPIAIANSHKNRWFKDEDPNDFLFKVTAVIRTYFLSYQKYHNDKMITVRYEDIVESPKASLNRLCNHLEINYNEEMLDNIDAFMFNAGTSENHEDLSKNIHIKNIDKYKSQLSKDQIQSLSYLLRDVIVFFGYPVSHVKPSKLLLGIERKVDSRLRYNRSFVRTYLRKIKYYLFYLKYTITR